MRYSKKCLIAPEIRHFPAFCGAERFDNIIETPRIRLLVNDSVTQFLLGMIEVTDMRSTSSGLRLGENLAVLLLSPLPRADG